MLNKYTTYNDLFQEYYLILEKQSSLNIKIIT